MASSDEETLGILESLINDFYSGSTSNERKRELELMLNSFTARSDSADYCLRFLTKSRSEFTIMYCLSVIESAINRSPSSLDRTAHQALLLMSIKSTLLKYLLSIYTVLPPFVVNKTAKLIVDIGKNNWPHNDPEFVNDFYALVQVKETCSVGLLLLQIFLEEFTMIKDGDLSCARKNELHKALMGQIPTIINLLSGVIEVTLDKHILNETTATPPPSPTHHFGQPGYQSDSLLINAFHLSLQRGINKSSGVMSQDSIRISSQCLNCLVSLVSWNLLHDISLINESLVAAIFVFATFGCHSSSNNSQSKNYDTIKLGTLAMSCINELIGKNVITTGSSDFICNIFTNTFNMLQSLIREENDVYKSCDGQFISKFTDFLKTFLTNHFSRYESHSTFPLNDFINCLLHFSFSPNSSSRLFSSLELWNIFLDVILEKKRNIRVDDLSNVFTMKYKSILITLLNEIRVKMQYKYNSAFIESLKDGDDDELLDGEDEMIDEKVVELTSGRRFINYCIEMISKIAQMVPMDSFNVVSEIFFENLSLYADLQYFITKSNVQVNNNGTVLSNSLIPHGMFKFTFEGNNFDFRKAHYSLQDLNSSLQAIGRFNSYFTHENFQERYSTARNFIEKLHQTLIYTNRFKLSSVECRDITISQDLIQVHSQLLATLGAYTYWLLQLSSSENESWKRDYNNFLSSLIDECVNLIAPETNDQDCMIKTSSGYVSSDVIHASLQLLSSIQETCRPQILLKSQSFHSLLKKTMISVKSLPSLSSDLRADRKDMKGLRLPIARDDEYVLVVFLSKSILVPWTRVSDSNQEWSNRSLHHDLLVKSISEPIKSSALSMTTSSLCSAINDQQMVHCIKQFLPLVTSMIRSHSESPSKSKQLLHSSITELNSVCGSLLNSYLTNPTIGSHLLDYFSTIFDVLRSQVKKDFIESIVSIVLNVSSNIPNFNPKSSDTSTILLERLFKMFTFVVQQPMSNGLKSALLPPITTLVIDQIAPHLMNNLLDLSSCDVLKTLFEFSHELIVNNFKYFFKNDSNPDRELTQPDLQFLSIMKLYGSIFVTLPNDITLFKFNIQSMQVLNVKFKLFTWDIFHKYNLWNSFLTCFMSTLTQSNNGKQSSSSNLLMDELIEIIFNLAFIDIGSFHSSFLPDFIHNHLGSSGELSSDQKQKLLHHDFVLKSLTDLPSFSLNLMQFTNDIKYYRKVTCNLSSNLPTTVTFTANNSPSKILNHGQ